MDASLIASIVVAGLASSGLWAFLQFLLSRKDKKTEYVTKTELNNITTNCAVKNEINSVKQDTVALTADVAKLKLSLQAILRDQIIHNYNKWSDKGYAPIYARENFENMYKQYHELGANGVITDIHNKFLELPTEKPVETNTDDKQD